MNTFIIREDCPKSEIEFDKRFSDIEKCYVYLLQTIWPDGFSCKLCGHTKYWISAKHVYICTRCEHQHSLTAGTIMDSSNLFRRTFKGGPLEVTRKRGYATPRPVWRPVKSVSPHSRVCRWFLAIEPSLASSLGLALRAVLRTERFRSHAESYGQPVAQRNLLARIVGTLSAIAVLLAFPHGSLASGPAVPGGPRSLAELEPHYRASVLRGWRTFQTSFAEDGVACVHCHTHHEDMRGWAGAYPKVQVFDNRPYRVKGLRQVVVEVLATHTDLPDEEQLSLVEDLVAYMSWWGDGMPVSPGQSKRLSPPRTDLAELRASVERGRALFQEGVSGPCNRCHRAEPGDDGELMTVAGAATSFPRYVAPADEVLCLESFLSFHLVAHLEQRHAPEEETTTDLAAYLMHLAVGQPLKPGTGNGE